MGNRLEKNSAAVRKAIESRRFTDEDGEEYEANKFGGFADYFRRKQEKLQNLDSELRAAAKDKPQIFKGVVAHVTGYTQPPLHVLHKELVQHGAGFLQYLGGKTMATHIIASTMPPTKAIDYSKYRVVKPAWVMDSIKAGRMLPWQDYRVITEGPKQKTIAFGSGKLVSKATPQKQASYREQSDNSFYTSQFKNAQSQVGGNPFRGPPQKSAYAPADFEIEDIEKWDDINFGSHEKVRTQGKTITEPLLSKHGQPSPAVSPSKPSSSAQRQSSPAIPAFKPPSSAKKPPIEPTTVSLEPPPSAQRPTSLPPTSAQRPPLLPKPAPEPPLPAQKPTPHLLAPPTKPMTAEEHNALLLADPKIRKSSAANPNFLKQYYSESRLHHLSTWKAQLKSRLQALAASKALPTASKKKRPSGARRYILHVDFDSFFCAVSSLKLPEEERGKPAAVAHGTGPGSEIASCNYPARVYGVRNGMWMARAMELCPTLRILPYDFTAYEDASGKFYEAILSIGGVVQAVSIDEALVDVTDIVMERTGSEGIGVSEGSVWREQKEVDQIALGLREEIKRKTGCNVSVGIGGNILLAKIALRKAKPAGQYHLRPEEVLEFIGELKVEDLPGVAYSIGGKLEEMGIKYVKDLRGVSKEKLASVLGPKTGEKLYEYARGIDRTEVGDQPMRKSVSADVNWGIRFVSQEEAEEFVRNLCKELERRLLNEGVKGRHLTMRIMRRSPDAPLEPAKHLGHGKCDVFTKSVAFGVPTNDPELIGKEAVTILRSFRFSPGDLRGIGLQMTKLEPIKPSGKPEGSQKKLTFAVPVKRQMEQAVEESNAQTAKQEPVKPVGKQEEAQNKVTFAPPPAKKQKTAATEAIEESDLQTYRPRPSEGPEIEDDPITDEPLTPPKPKVHPALALAKAGEADEKAISPLNIAGTQFIIPSNPDPAILAELPQDIRSRLVHPQQARRTPPAPAQPEPASQPHPPDLPPDVDPEVFAALPDDVKAEVLAEYRVQRPQQQRSPPRHGKGGLKQQTLLPQSPHKNRVIFKPPVPRTSTKRGSGGRGRGGLFSHASRAHERKKDREAGLRQTRFVAIPRRLIEQYHGKDPNEEDDEPDIPELDPNTLAELPTQIRTKVVAEHRAAKERQRQRRLERNGAVLTFYAPTPPMGVELRRELDKRWENRLRGVKFPPLPTHAKLASKEIKTLEEVREMVSTWYEESREEGGPHPEDVECFAEWLAQVVKGERNIEKAGKVLRWLEWIVSEGEPDGQEGEGDEGQKEWREALEIVRIRVNQAMEERGLGKLKIH